MPGSLRARRSAGGGVNADALIRACSWLNRDARDFAKQAWKPEVPLQSKSGTRRVEPVD